MTSTGTASASETLDAETHRQLGKDLYNRTWALIEATDRTPETDDEMVFSAHASAYHWSKSGGTLANAARSHWQIARVYSTLGRGEPAVWHSRRCLALAEAAVKAWGRRRLGRPGGARGARPPRRRSRATVRPQRARERAPARPCRPSPIPRTAS
jgi:hypothetical protein